ncbi:MULTISPECIES: alpha/beta hydrolase [Halomonas]|uniref:Phospholipase/carboxylesterase n=1 Tax=Halomonas halophila TaxID=29573 RepID=A0ABQ0U2F4_9GAMM|nr:MULTISPECIES: dienelactone hydrolase family protein [Halomonas]MDR5890548.1 dienelactone hydrolase family protein [Halomonas salina]RAH38442.1 carboxylesterase [Halomonas sp. SL1]WJY08256.1 dienelactone hydrolase family protein [Halomonas halophila]GEK72612.1 phospholipase/carboxylesterase [Halomonas halophila]
MSAPDELIIEPRSGRPADACVFILHGLGADGHDFEPLVPALGLPDDLDVRFILPHAPRLPVTINGGMTMPAWYDILEASLDRRVDEAQLKASAERIQGLMHEQIAQGVPAERIIVAGFSQGGAVAYQAALTFPERLGGLLAMSTYLATVDSLEPAAANRDLPIEIHHGNADPVVPEALGQAARDRLEALGYPVRYRQYPMPHAVCPQQVADIGPWIAARLGR